MERDYEEVSDLSQSVYEATKPCSERVEKNYTDTISGLRELMEEYYSDDEKVSEPAYERFWDYGLCFDYVGPEGKQAPYFRWQLSWGGPSDEFRFFVDHKLEPTDIEYWFLDWFDGSKVDVEDTEDFELLCDIFSKFADVGEVKRRFNEFYEL